MGITRWEAARIDAKIKEAVYSLRERIGLLEARVDELETGAIKSELEKEKAETPVKESRPRCLGCSDCAMGGSGSYCSPGNYAKDSGLDLIT